MASSSQVADVLQETLEALERLVEDHEAARDVPDEGENNFRCEACIACRDCRFCTGCQGCVECTYCEGCESCDSCTQCRGCEGCSRTTHADHSADCIGCSYVTLCLHCEDCVHCFASVGLAGEEFCILNERLPKAAYFKRVAELRDALARKISAGWRPPWSIVHEEEEQEEGDPVPSVVALDTTSPDLGRRLTIPPLPPPPEFPTLEVDPAEAPVVREESRPLFFPMDEEESGVHLLSEASLDPRAPPRRDLPPWREVSEEGPTRPFPVVGATVTRATRPRRPGASDEPTPGAATLRAGRRPPRRPR